MHPIEYPFIIRGPTRANLIKVVADSYRNALNKVLYKHQGKWIKTQFAKRMVLTEAKIAAQKESKAQKGKLFLVTVNDKDGEVDYGTVNKSGHTIHNQFLNGKEVKMDLPPVVKNIDPQKVIKTTNKQIKEEMKKENGKNAVKAATKAASTKVVKKIAGAKMMKAVELGKAIQKGDHVFAATGRKLSPGKLLKTNKTYQVTSKKNKEGIMEHQMHKG